MMSRNQNVGQCHPRTLSDMERVKPLMKNFTSWKQPCPVHVGSVDSDVCSTASSVPSSVSSTTDDEVVPLQNFHGGPLLPRLPKKHGHRRFTIRVLNIGLKDASTLIQPTITVSVKDDIGLNISQDQVISAPYKTEPTHLHFDQDIEIQKYMEKLFKGSAIFFEIKHWKPKRKMTKLKCYSFLDQKAIQPGPISLRLLEKPIDYTKRRNVFITKKPLYLNLHITIHDV